MGKEELIKEGHINKLKQQRAAAVISAKESLRLLVSEGAYARTKPVEEINTAGLTLHLEQLVAKQEEVKRIDEEIKELEY